MATQESVLRVGVDSAPAEQGSRRVENALGRLGVKAKSTEGNFDKLSTTLSAFGVLMGTLGAGLLVSEFMRLTDVTTTLDNKIRAVTNTQAEANVVYRELVALSNSTYTSLEETTDSYNKYARALRNLNPTYRETLDFTRALNLAMRVSYTDAQAGASGIRQLAQAMTTGALRGDEYVSVNENLPRVMDAIARSTGKTRFELKQLAGDSQLTAEMIYTALMEELPQLEEEFARMTPTIGNAFTVLQNKVLDTVHGFNQANSVGAILARGILFIADNFNVLLGAATGVAIVIGGALVAAFARLSLAMLTNPFGLLVVAIGAATAAISYFGDLSFEVAGKTVTGWQAIRAAFTVISQVVQEVASTVSAFLAPAFDEATTTASEGAEETATTWTSVFSAAFDYVANQLNGIVGFFIGAYEVITGGMDVIWIGAQLVSVRMRNIFASGIQWVVDTFRDAFAALASVFDSFSTMFGGDGGLEERVRSALTIKIPEMDTSELDKGYDEAVDKVTRGDQRMGVAMRNEAGEDYLGFGNFKERFAITAAEIAQQDALNEELLNNAWAGNTNEVNANTDASKEAAKAAEKLRRERERLTRQIQNDYDSLLEATGNETQVVQTWRDEQVAALREVGLENTKYAGMVEEVFRDKIATARLNDVRNSQEWMRGLNRAQREVAESVRDAFTSMRETYGGAVDNVKEWRRQTIEDLEAVGLANDEYLAKVEEVFGRKLVDARRRDLESSREWADGVALAFDQIGEKTSDMQARATAAITSMEERLNGPLRQIQDSVGALNELFARGSITLEQYTTKMRELGLESLNLKLEMGQGDFGDAMLASIGRLTEGYTTMLAGVSQSFGDFFQRVGDGFADTIGRAIVYGDDLGDSLMNVARSAMAELISSLVKLGIQFLINQVLGQSLAAAATAAGVAQASILASAWAPAAAMVSLATFGANSIPAMTGMGTATAFAMVLSKMGGFELGGYTGNGGRSEIAGVVHGQEFVVNADATAQYRSVLEAMNAGRPVRAVPKTAAAPSAATFSPGSTSGGRVVNMGNTTIIVQGNVVEDTLEAMRVMLDENRQQAVQEAREAVREDQDYAMSRQVI